VIRALQSHDMRHRTRGISFALALCLAGPGCADPATAPGARLPAGAMAFDPPLDYERWWRKTEDCSGLTGDYAAVRWYAVSGDVVVAGTAYDAYWFATGNRIVLAERVRRDELVIRHEALHALLRRGDHPAEYFQQRCAGVVDCNVVCRAG